MVHQNVRKIRLAKGIKQNYIAERMKISDMAYSRIERGETRLDAEKLKEIAILLNTPIQVFFDDELTESVILDIENCNIPSIKQII